MATKGQQFPPQHQPTQAGKEYIMNPKPQFSNPQYKPSNKLFRKVALVTGSDSGIGRSVAYCFVLEGATVAFTYVKGKEDRDAQDTLEILRGCRTAENNQLVAMAVAADLRFDKECKRVVEEVVAAFGRIDILVNGATVQFTGTVEEIDEERLERMFRTNIFSHFFMVRHSLKHMLDYSATKGAIVSFTRTLALQLVSRGIRVNGVAPGPIWTPLIPATFDNEDIERFGSDVLMKRAGQPIEVAPSYVFLACNHCSSYFTGQILHPNVKDDEILNTINKYRESKNLSQLIHNKNAACLASRLVYRLRDQACTNADDFNKQVSYETEFSDFQKLLAKCHIANNSWVDGITLPACVPKLEPASVVSNFTHSHDVNYLNDGNFTGAGVGTTDDWVVIVLSTNTSGGNFMTGGSFSVVARGGFIGVIGSFLGLFVLLLML